MKKILTLLALVASVSSAHAANLSLAELIPQASPVDGYYRAAQTQPQTVTVVQPQSYYGVQQIPAQPGQPAEQKAPSTIVQLDFW